MPKDGARWLGELEAAGKNCNVICLDCGLRAEYTPAEIIAIIGDMSAPEAVEPRR